MSQRWVSTIGHRWPNTLSAASPLNALNLVHRDSWTSITWQDITALSEIKKTFIDVQIVRSLSLSLFTDCHSLYDQLMHSEKSLNSTGRWSYAANVCKRQKKKLPKEEFGLSFAVQSPFLHSPHAHILCALALCARPVVSSLSFRESFSHVMCLLCVFNQIVDTHLDDVVFV